MNNQNDQSLAPSDSIELLNEFLRIYNDKYQKNGSMFENINIKDPLSTNDKTELFYDYMQIHQNLQTRNQDLIDVYDPNDPIPMSDEYDIYVLVVGDDRKKKYKSLSFISLLYVGYMSIKNKLLWNIVSL